MLRNKFNFLLDNEIYCRRAVAEARSCFRQYCSVRATPASAGQLELSIAVCRSYRGQAREVVLEFLNYTLDRSIQIELEEVE